MKNFDKLNERDKNSLVNFAKRFDHHTRQDVITMISQSHKVKITETELQDLLA
ncbi:hypothetical protein N9878_00680 [bacterium]|nr:hypothetical protein [bacterium]